MIGAYGIGRRDQLAHQADGGSGESVGGERPSATG